MQRLRTHKLPNYTCVYWRVVSKYRSDLRDDRHELSTGAPVTACTVVCVCMQQTTVVAQWIVVCLPKKVNRYRCLLHRHR